MENCSNEICRESFWCQRALQWMEPNATTRWLNEGEVLSPADGESINLYGKIAVLVAGQASPGASEPNSAPAHLDLAEAVFQDNAKVFVRDAKGKKMAERAGFEPAVPCGTQHFQCCTIGHSVTSPRNVFNACDLRNSSTIKTPGSQLAEIEK